MADRYRFKLFEEPPRSELERFEEILDESPHFLEEAKALYSLSDEEVERRLKKLLKSGNSK